MPRCHVLEALEIGAPFDMFECNIQSPATVQASNILLKEAKGDVSVLILHLPLQ